MSCVKKKFFPFLPVLTSVAIIAMIVNTASAAVVIMGDVSPSDSSGWDSETSSYIGGYSTGDGSVSITAGDGLSSRSGYLGGFMADASGTMTVDGAGSTWNVVGGVYIGSSNAGSNGVLNITNGGLVTVDRVTEVTQTATSGGTLNFGSAGGTLSTKSLYLAAPGQLTGTGTVVTHGLISDLDVTFDSTSGLNQTLAGFGSVTVNLDMSDSTNVGELGAGYGGAGTLAINGTVVNSAILRLGHNTGSSGTATVNGAVWNTVGGTAAYCYVGYYGSGTLQIENGGTVNVDANAPSINIGNQTGSSGRLLVTGSSSSFNTFGSGDLFVGKSGSGILEVSQGGSVVNNDVCRVGSNSGASGTVTVSGNGSTWTNGNDIYVGYSGAGTVRIENGGYVSGNADCTIANVSGSSGTITVTGADSTLACDTVVIGQQGQGVLNIGDDGKVVGDLKVGGFMGGVGTVNFDGGILATDNASSNWIASGFFSTAAVYIKEGGATFDTDAYGMGITLALQHGGSGVDGGLTKLGTGALALSEDNTYIGDTTVREGTLVLGSSGSLLLDINDAANSLITVDSGASLDLSGKIKLDFTDVTVDSGLWTLIDSDGTTTYGSSFALTTSGGAPFTELSDVWTYTTGLSTWTFTESTGYLSLNTVPEPASLALLACGLVGLLAYAWRKQK